MKYISVCSGIEAATVAWHPLGWEAKAFSEIEPFPCKVLAHHYQTVPNLGDMTKFKEWPDYANVDVLVGGTPCQSFSIAGLRKGLDDPRGNLMLTYLAIADKYRPTWVAWENVPGVLSSNRGRDFGTFLGGLGQLGYGFAYRVLDAQYVRTDGYPHAVPQRRRRVFVVGHLGRWQRAAAVLFDSESLHRDSSQIQKQQLRGLRKSIIGCLPTRTGQYTRSELDRLIFDYKKNTIRTLTPLECERAQAFPDNYTNIPGASDTARYKALGNSMAVNVMQLIGIRIQMVSDIPELTHQERAQCLASA